MESGFIISLIIITIPAVVIMIFFRSNIKNVKKTKTDSEHDYTIF